MNQQERIKADAQAYANGIGDVYRKYAAQYGYIAGATAEHDRTKVLADALEKFISYHETGLLPARHVYEQAVAAREQWKSGKGKEVHVELSCMVCGATFMGPEPQMCCSGRDCGCMGMPIDPIVCSKECYDKGIPPQRGGSGVNI